MNIRKALCVALVGAASTTVANADNVNLSLSVDQVAHTWKAYLNVNNGPGVTVNTLGLDSTDFTVTSSGGVTLGNTSDPNTLNDLPPGTSAPYNLTWTARSSESAGFFNFNSVKNVTGGVEFTGGQGLTWDINAANGHSNIVQGFGITGHVNGPFGDAAGSPYGPWGDPALVAEGTYTGTNGMITIAGVSTTPSAQNPGGTNTLLLPQVASTATQTTANSGPSVGPHYAAQVQGSSVTVGAVAVPLPAPFWSVAVLLSGLGAARKLRRA